MNRRAVLKSSLSLAALGAAQPLWANTKTLLPPSIDVTQPAFGSASQGAGWADLKGITINEQVTETSYQVIKTFPEAIKNGVKDIELTGYAAPITPSAMVTELILISDLDSCPYCSLLDHNATALIKLSTPIPEFAQNARVTVKGDFRPNTNPLTWEAAIIENATVVELVEL